MTWGRNVEAVKFLRKRKHFEERSWKQKQTRKRLTLCGAGSGSKNILPLPHPWFKRSVNNKQSHQVIETKQRKDVNLIERLFVV